MRAALRRFLLRLRNAVSPSRAERELDREVQSHLQLLTDDFRRQGMSQAEALRAARLALGGVGPVKDGHRDARSFVWLDDLRRDSAYALRTLLRTPGFTAVAILTLALSIGASTAIFAVVDHVLVRSLPLPDADRLVRLYESNASAGRLKQDVSPPHADDWRRASKTIDVLALIGGTRVTMTGGAEPESVVGMLVGPEFFSLTGVTMALGRPFDKAEYNSIANALLGPFALRDSATGEAAVIISHALWLRQFGGDSSVVGRRVQLNGSPAVIQGVMPPGFRMDESAWGIADCWIPHVPSYMAKQRRFRQFIAIARLKPGVTPERAQAELNAINKGLGAQYPNDDAGWTIDAVPLKDSVVGDSRLTLLVFLGGVTCLLLIACANLANLLLVRAAGREREAAVRMAIGAGRSRLVRQWLTESVVLAMIGGLVGFLIVVWAVPALVAHSPLNLPRLDNVVVDVRIFLASVGISLATGLLCGLAPVLGLRSVRLTSLRVSGAAGTARHRWLRPTLLAVQVGLAIVLLAGAGLMGRTLLAVSRVDLGFVPDHVLTFGVDMRRLQRQNSDLEFTRAFMKDLTERLARVPGVQAAGIGGIPLQGTLTNDFIVEGRTDPVDTMMNVPTPGYFRAVGTRLRSGRVFTAADDAKAPLVAVVNQAFAHAAWGTADVVGRRLQYAPKSRDLTVVGVIDDVRMSTLESAAPSMVYVPAAQCTVATMSTYVIRTTGDPSAAIPVVRDVIRSVDPALALMRPEPLTDRVARAIAPRQFNVWLVGLFALVALVLAVVGIYGLISEAVANRTPEIGVRMALGAGRVQVIRLVAGRTVLIACIGLVVGVAATTVLTRWLGAMIFGVEPLDPVTLVTVPLVFVACGAVAALVPARRATRIDPVRALRGE